MKKILIIDDNQEIRENLSETLELAKYSVITEDNGQSGLDTARKEIPDLILSDVMMPGLNGYEVLLKLKENILTEKIPVILLTASSEKHDKQHGLTLGASDYITKPFDIDDLLCIIESRIVQSDLKKSKAAFENVEQADIIENLIRMISHNVRKPVCTTLGLMQLLESKKNNISSDDELKEIITHMKTSTLELDMFTKEFTVFLDSLKSKYRDKK